MNSGKHFPGCNSTPRLIGTNKSIRRCASKQADNRLLVACHSRKIHLNVQEVLLVMTGESSTRIDRTCLESFFFFFFTTVKKHRRANINCPTFYIVQLKCYCWKERISNHPSFCSKRQITCKYGIFYCAA